MSELTQEEQTDILRKEKAVKNHMEKLLREHAPRNWENWRGDTQEEAAKMAFRYLGQNWLHDLWCHWYVKKWELPMSVPDHMRQYALPPEEEKPAGCC